jgi:hypothetical protein
MQNEHTYREQCDEGDGGIVVSSRPEREDDKRKHANRDKDRKNAHDEPENARATGLEGHDGAVQARADVEVLQERQPHKGASHCQRDVPSSCRQSIVESGGQK